MRNLTRRAFLWLLGCMFPCCPVVHTLARDSDYVVLTEEQVQCINRQIDAELEANPFYSWGGAGLEVGAPGDCSGKLYAIFFRCGVPVQRVTASMMSRGLGGWRFPVVEWCEGKRLAIVSMTTQPHRPDGHVGILTEDVQYGSLAMMAHESSRLGFVKVFVEKRTDGTLDMGITQIRQVQHGRGHGGAHGR